MQTFQTSVAVRFLGAGGRWTAVAVLPLVLIALGVLAGCGQKGVLLLPGAASAVPMSPGGVPAPPLPATLSPAPLPPVRS